jgi:hypothetical protein
MRHISIVWHVLPWPCFFYLSFSTFKWFSLQNLILMGSSVEHTHVRSNLQPTMPSPSSLNGMGCHVPCMSTPDHPQLAWIFCPYI